MKKKAHFISSDWKGRWKWLWNGDRPWIGAFIVFDISLLLLAHSYFLSINELSVTNVSRSPAGQDNATLVELQRLARRGSLNEFENARMEKVAQYLQTNSRPSPGDALYFYPETLPAQSFEKEFAIKELKPRIEAVFQAHRSKKVLEANQAFQQLQGRVLNFELGASADPTDLSDEAKNFLSLYFEFTKLSH